MKIAAPFIFNSKWKDIPDEYNIEFNKTSTIQKVLDFYEEYDNTKRINITFNIELKEDSIKELIDQCPNLYIKLRPDQLYLVGFLRKEKIKFFFGNDIPCYSIGMLDFMINQGTSDIYIYDSLFYNLEEVKKKCNNNNVAIRLVLNKIPSLRPDAGFNFQAPIFTPRDFPFLNEYIDTAEFDCYINDGKGYNWNQFNVLYKVWFKNQNWIGELKEINKDVKIFIPVNSLLPNLWDKKFHCEQQCLYGIKCTRCEDILEIAQWLNAEGIYLKKKEGKSVEKE